MCPLPGDPSPATMGRRRETVMSADLHLYVVEDKVWEDLLATEFDWDEARDQDHDPYATLTNDWNNTNVWAGQVSWLRGGPDHVPLPVLYLDRMFRSAPVVTPKLVKAAVRVAAKPDRSRYARREYLYDRNSVELNWRYGRRIRVGKFKILVFKSRGVARPREIGKFLAKNMGKRVLSITL